MFSHTSTFLFLIFIDTFGPSWRTNHFSIWHLMMVKKKRLCLVTFHFAFVPRGNYLVSAHSYGPYHFRHNFTRFSFLGFFSHSTTHTRISSSYNSSKFSFPRKCFSLAHLSARWCQRKSSCDKETWLESSNWTLELFMTTLVLFNLFGLGLWAFDTPLNWGILWH